MKGFSPKLPLAYDTIDGSYNMNKTAVEAIKQDFKMLLLTNPGERVMEPAFGVGLKKYLFEQDTELLRTNISNNILRQTSNYLSFIVIDNIFINTPQDTNNNTLYITINYSIPGINYKDELNLVIT
jgi:phage baseplate assembly protein W